MARAPFQILVLPFRQVEGRTLEFAVFCRSDERYWQGIAGGGEGDETPLDAARRESFEEAGISPAASFISLQTTASIQVRWFRDSQLWGEDEYVIPEYAFGVDCGQIQLKLSPEHGAVRWLPFAAAYDILRFDSNRTALWELHQRIRGRGPRDERTE